MIWKITYIVKTNDHKIDKKTPSIIENTIAHFTHNISILTKYICMENLKNILAMCVSLSSLEQVSIPT